MKAIETEYSLGGYRYYLVEVVFSEEKKVYFLDMNLPSDKREIEITQKQAEDLADYREDLVLGINIPLHRIKEGKEDQIEAIMNNEPYNSCKEALEKIEKERKLSEEKERQYIQSKKDEAKRTNMPILIRQTFLPEKLTPLAKDQEDDIVTCSLYAMPDGTLKNTYSHNY